MIWLKSCRSDLQPLVPGLLSLRRHHCTPTPSCPVWGLLRTSPTRVGGEPKTRIYYKLCPLRGPGSSEILTQWERPELRSWFLNIIPQLREQELLGEVVDSRAGNHTGKIRDEPRSSFGVQKVKKVLKKDRAWWEGTDDTLKELLKWPKME